MYYFLFFLFLWQAANGSVTLPSLSKKNYEFYEIATQGLTLHLKTYFFLKDQSLPFSQSVKEKCKNFFLPLKKSEGDSVPVNFYFREHKDIYEIFKVYKEVLDNKRLMVPITAGAIAKFQDKEVLDNKRLESPKAVGTIAESQVNALDKSRSAQKPLPEQDGPSEESTSLEGSKDPEIPPAEKNKVTSSFPIWATAVPESWCTITYNEKDKKMQGRHIVFDRDVYCAVDMHQKTLKYKEAAEKIFPWEKEMAFALWAEKLYDQYLFGASLFFLSQALFYTDNPTEVINKYRNHLKNKSEIKNFSCSWVNGRIAQHTLQNRLDHLPDIVVRMALWVFPSLDKKALESKKFIYALYDLPTNRTTSYKKARERGEEQWPLTLFSPAFFFTPYTHHIVVTEWSTNRPIFSKIFGNAFLVNTRELFLASFGPYRGKLAYLYTYVPSFFRKIISSLFSIVKQAIEGYVEEVRSISYDNDSLEAQCFYFSFMHKLYKKRALYVKDLGSEKYAELVNLLSAHYSTLSGCYETAKNECEKEIKKSKINEAKAFKRLEYYMATEKKIFLDPFFPFVSTTKVGKLFYENIIATNIGQNSSYSKDRDQLLNRILENKNLSVKYSLKEDEWRSCLASLLEYDLATHSLFIYELEHMPRRFFSSFFVANYVTNFVRELKAVCQKSEKLIGQLKPGDPYLRQQNKQLTTHSLFIYGLEHIRHFSSPSYITNFVRTYITNFVRKLKAVRQNSEKLIGQLKPGNLYLRQQNKQAEEDSLNSTFSHNDKEHNDTNFTLEQNSLSFYSELIKINNKQVALNRYDYLVPGSLPHKEDWKFHLLCLALLIKKYPDRVAEEVKRYESIIGQPLLTGKREAVLLIDSDLSEEQIQTILTLEKNPEKIETTEIFKEIIGRSSEEVLEEITQKNPTFFSAESDEETKKKFIEKYKKTSVIKKVIDDKSAKLLQEENPFCFLFEYENKVFCLFKGKILFKAKKRKTKSKMKEEEGLYLLSINPL